MPIALDPAVITWTTRQVHVSAIAPPSQLPSTISHNAWRINGLGMDFHVDVPGQVAWTRPESSRIVEDPNGGPPTLILRGDGTLPKRRGQLTFGTYGPDMQLRTHRQQGRALIERAWALKGPFALTTPEGETFNFVFDPSGGGLKEEWQAGDRIFTVGIIEVL